MVTNVSLEEGGQSFRGDFGLRFDFNRNSPNPSRVFLTLAELINALEATDKTLINSIDASIQPTFLLENIEEGSILVWLKTMLESLDDEGLKELNPAKIVGSYLVKGKYAIIDFLNKRTGIDSVEQVIELQATLVELAEETKTNALDSYDRVNLGELLEDIGSIQAPLARLEPGENIYYLTPTETVAFNVFFNISPESIEDLATKRTINAVMTMILKIKTVDYLGQAQWEFKHERRTIRAKLVDVDWIRSFKERRFALLPGDALDAEVQVITKYDYNNEVISTQYTIVKVNEILPGISVEQTTLELEPEADVESDD